MIRYISYLIVILTFSTSFIITNNGHKKNSLKRTNPLLQKSALPYEAPPFKEISNEDFMPALEEGMRLQIQEINKIADNPISPTFQNTIIALEKSGRLLDRVNNIFSLFTGANTNAVLQKIQEEEAPKQAAHADAIHFNSKLFKRIETIYNIRKALKLDQESTKLVEYYYQQFVLAGANLSDVDKINLKRLNEKEASLTAKFSNQLLAATKNGAVVINDVSELQGLSQGDLDALAQNAKAKNLPGKWLISLQNTTQQPLLQSLSISATREKLFNASYLRAERNDSNDTRQTISQIAKLRAEKAKLIGFPNFASLALQDQMAKTPDAVDQFFAKLVPAATAKAALEAREIQEIIGKESSRNLNGMKQTSDSAENTNLKLQPWDWNYYAEKLRKQKYDLNEAEIKPYFELNNVLENGVFYAANLLYGLTFKERHDIPIYQNEVRVFEVLDKDNSTIGLFYGDYYKRDNKSGGAWMNNLVGQSKLLGTKPVIYNICNFTKPAKGQPALLSFDDVTTMFHEFGHALHGFFSNEKYQSISGTNVARDFVEFPSQFNEHWALYPTILHHYARHYKTHELMPQSLADKIKKAATFNQGYRLTELLSAAALDMQWHKISAEEEFKDVDQFETAALMKTGLNLAAVPTRYRSSYFLHIWSNGYAAGYYAYLWTEMLDDDAFDWFKKNGGLTIANGQRFRDMILSRGNTEDYNIMFHQFTGHAPNIEPMEESRGLR